MKFSRGGSNHEQERMKAAAIAIAEAAESLQ